MTWDRIPDTFQLRRYGISPEDVVRSVLHCEPAAHDCFLAPAEPDPGLERSLREVAWRLCREAGVPLHEGTVFSTDSIVAQFAHLDDLVARHGCIGIEMETAAVFRAARLLGIRAAALLQFSDVIPACKSVFSGRTEEEMVQRRRIRQDTLARIVLETLVGPCQASNDGGPRLVVRARGAPSLTVAPPPPARQPLAEALRPGA